MSSINNTCYNKLFTMYYYDTESLFSYFALMFIVDYTLARLQRAEETCNKRQIDLNAIACMRTQLLFIYYYTSYYINLIAECHTIFYVHDTRLLLWITANFTDLVSITLIFISVLTILAELDITEEVIEAISREFLTKTKTTVKGSTLSYICDLLFLPCISCGWLAYCFR